MSNKRFVLVGLSICAAVIITTLIVIALVSA